MVIPGSHYSVEVSLIFPTFFANIHVIRLQIRVVVVVVECTNTLLPPKFILISEEQVKRNLIICDYTLNSIYFVLLI